MERWYPNTWKQIDILLNRKQQGNVCLTHKANLFTSHQCLHGTMDCFKLHCKAENKSQLMALPFLRRTGGRTNLWLCNDSHWNMWLGRLKLPSHGVYEPCGLEAGISDYCHTGLVMSKSILWPTVWTCYEPNSSPKWVAVLKYWIHSHKNIHIHRNSYCHTSTEPYKPISVLSMQVDLLCYECKLHK